MLACLLDVKAGTGQKLILSKELLANTTLCNQLQTKYKTKIQSNLVTLKAAKTKALYTRMRKEPRREPLQKIKRNP